MYKKFWNEETETLSASRQQKLEEMELKKQIEYVYGNSPFYQRKFMEAGVSSKKIKHIEDLSKLPFTEKAELRESQEKNPPYGDYLAANQEKVSRVHRTAGSTGKALYSALTKKDLKQTNDVGARCFWAGGLRPHHTVVHCLNYCLWMGGFTDHTNLETTGATVVPFGVRNSNLLVRVIKEIGIDAISSTPSYPNYLVDVVRSELGIEPIELGLKLGLFGGEPGLEDPNFKKLLEETWGMRASNANYGMADVLCTFASECDEVSELHFLAQGALIAQLVDPITGEDIEIEEGIQGELVYTNIARESQPLIRLRSHDMALILGTGPCKCGRTGFRFKMIGRSDDMLHVKGVNVFPSGIFEVLLGMRPEVTSEFLILLDKPGPYTSLNLRIEHAEGIKSKDLEGLKKKIQTKIRDLLTFHAEIELVPPKSIPKPEGGKVRRIVRKYQGETA
jgi:phenylacetate-CoA ligase